MIAIAIPGGRLNGLLIRLLLVAAAAFATFSTAAFFLSTRAHNQAAVTRADMAACNELITLSVVLMGEQPAGVLNFIRQRVNSRLFVYGFSDGDRQVVAVPADNDDFMMRARLQKTAADLDCAALTSPQLATYLTAKLGVEFFQQTRVEKDGHPFLLKRLGGTAGSGGLQIDVAVPLPSDVPLLPHIQLAFSVFLLVILVVFGMSEHRRFQRRIDGLNRVFDEVRRGNTAARPDPDGRTDEIARLTGFISNALQRIQSLVEQTHIITLEVSHEIKRPLTPVMHRIWEAKNTTTEPHIQELLTDSYNRMRVIKDTLQELLDFGVVSGLGDALQDRFDSVELGAVLEKISVDSEKKAAAKNLRIIWNIAAHIRVLGSSTMLRILFDNLIDNAIKYSEQGVVEVSLAAEGEERFAFRVRDHGPGFPLGLEGHLMTPMYRGGMNGDIDGHGLGLSLVLHIAVRHDYRVDHHNLNPGCEAIVTGSRLR